MLAQGLHTTLTKNHKREVDQKKSTDIDSNPSFSGVPQDDDATEDEPDPWVGCTVCAAQKADDLMTANVIEP